MKAVLPLSLNAFLLAGVAFLQGCDASQATMAEAPPPAPEVTVEAVRIQAVRDWQEFTGRLEATDVVELRPRVGGYIESLHFQEGSRVRRGDLLFRIDARPF